MSFINSSLPSREHSSLLSLRNSYALSSPLPVPSSPPCSSQDQTFPFLIAPKRSREVTSEVSSARPRSKPCVSQLLSITAALELFASKASFWHYSEFFHGRDLVAGRKFNLSTLTATGLQFEEKLTQCGLRSLATIEQDVFPEWVWQFYSNAQFGEDLLVTRVQGQEVSFFAALINQLLGTSQDRIFSFNEVQVLPFSKKALNAEEWLLHRFNVYHLIGRSGSLNTLSSEDLILVSTLHQGIRLNFGRFMMERVQFMVDKILR